VFVHVVHVHVKVHVGKRCLNLQSSSTSLLINSLSLNYTSVIVQGLINKQIRNCFFFLHNIILGRSLGVKKKEIILSDHICSKYVSYDFEISGCI